MTKNSMRRHTRGRGKGARLVGGAFSTAALIGIGVTQASGPVPEHPLGIPAHLLAFPDSPGPDAFTIGPYELDPVKSLAICVGVGLCTGGSEGWTPFSSPVFPGPPLMDIAGGAMGGISLAGQSFEVYNPSTHAIIGSIGAAGTAIQLFGQTSYEFTVNNISPVLGQSAANLPAMGTVYDVFDLNLPIPGIPALTNVYEATPGGAVNDWILIGGHAYNITSPVPLPGGGSLNLAGLLTQNYTGDLNPGNAFSNLVATSGDSKIGPEAFTINVPGFHYTLDPFDTALTRDTYTAVSPLASFAPIFAAGGANIHIAGLNVPVIVQGFNVYNDAGVNVGSFDTTEFVTQVLGTTTTEEVVTSVDPHLLQGGTAADLPAVGTVFSVTNQTPFNIGSLDTIYIAKPGEPATITTVTPLGDITTPAPFNVDAAGDAEMNPASIFASLVSEQASQNVGISTPPLGPDISQYAFTINGLTFGPETTLLAAGYNDLSQTSGGAPLMAVFGGGQITAAGIPLVSLGPQDFFYYTGQGADATERGELTTSVAVVDLLSFQNASVTVTGCLSVICPDMPAKGTVFDVLNLGLGINNIYEGSPNGQVFDEIVTPLGPLFDIKLQLPASLDAGVDLNPADIVPAGLDVPF